MCRLHTSSSRRYWKEENGCTPVAVHLSVGIVTWIRFHQVRWPTSPVPNSLRYPLSTGPDRRLVHTFPFFALLEPTDPPPTRSSRVCSFTVKISRLLVADTSRPPHISQFLTGSSEPKPSLLDRPRATSSQSRVPVTFDLHTRLSPGLSTASPDPVRVRVGE